MCHPALCGPGHQTRLRACPVDPRPVFPSSKEGRKRPGGREPWERRARGQLLVSNTAAVRRPSSMGSVDRDPQGSPWGWTSSRELLTREALRKGWPSWGCGSLALCLGARPRLDAIFPVPSLLASSLSSRESLTLATTAGRSACLQPGAQGRHLGDHVMAGTEVLMTMV